MPAARLSIEGVTEQQRAFDLSRKARFKEVIYRPRTTARWKNFLFCFVDTGDVQDDGRSRPNPFRGLSQGAEGKTAPSD